LPVFDRVIVCGLVLPTATLPKFTLAGLIDNCDCVCVAVPLSTIESEEFVALLVIVIVPVGLPAVVGANIALKDVFAPAGINTAPDRPLMP
jgi:hypothetical protein